MGATGELVSERIEDEFEMEDDSSADLSSEALREGGSLGEGGRTIIFGRDGLRAVRLISQADFVPCPSVS
jgi:hypothetical protein